VSCAEFELLHDSDLYVIQMNFLKIIYRLIPSSIRQKRHELKLLILKPYWLLRNGIHDICRVACHSSALKAKGTRDNQKARLTFHYHKIEKAMALPQPRAGFGRQWIVEEFIPLLRQYHAEYGCDDVVGRCCLNLLDYMNFNKNLGIQLPEVYEKIDMTLRTIGTPPSHIVGGVKMVKSAEIETASSIDFVRFTESRHSIRNFSDKSVDRELIEKAIGIAQRTPSVCNRQPWHVYALLEKRNIADALKLQNGNVGFSGNIQVLLIIAGDLSAIMHSSERNEIWVDGGMFSMSLVYALHSLGLGTCCLNLCYNFFQEKQLRSFVKMAPPHSPVMMIAVGYIPDSLYVAHSQRNPIQEVVTWK
jgi:nitroreductase